VVYFHERRAWQQVSENEIGGVRESEKGYSALNDGDLRPFRFVPKIRPRRAMGGLFQEAQIPSHLAGRPLVDRPKVGVGVQCSPLSGPLPSCE
jgi:hypothetical protein